MKFNVIKCHLDKVNIFQSVFMKNDYNVQENGA